MFGALSRFFKSLTTGSRPQNESFLGDRPKARMDNIPIDTLDRFLEDAIHLVVLTWPHPSIFTKLHDFDEEGALTAEERVAVLEDVKTLIITTLWWFIIEEEKSGRLIPKVDIAARVKAAYGVALFTHLVQVFDAEDPGLVAAMQVWSEQTQRPIELIESAQHLLSKASPGSDMASQPARAIMAACCTVWAGLHFPEETEAKKNGAVTRLGIYCWMTAHEAFKEFAAPIQRILC